jgi:hypothetical protein
MMFLEALRDNDEEGRRSEGPEFVGVVAGIKA